MRTYRRVRSWYMARAMAKIESKMDHDRVHFRPKQVQWFHALLLVVLGLCVWTIVTTDSKALVVWNTLLIAVVGHSAADYAKTAGTVCWFRGHRTHLTMIGPGDGHPRFVNVSTGGPKGMELMHEWAEAAVTEGGMQIVNADCERCCWLEGRSDVIATRLQRNQDPLAWRREP